MKKFILMAGVFGILFTSCHNVKIVKNENEEVNGYAKVTLNTDLSRFKDQDKKMMSVLCEAAEIMDEIFWNEAYPGNRDQFLSSIPDPVMRKFAQINYGPWDRLNGNKPFVGGYGWKALGACFYPENMSQNEFNELQDPNKNSLYTILTRDEKGALKVVWYHEYFKEEIERAAALLDAAAEMSSDAGFAHYLKLRAQALRTDDYFESDLAWMDAKNSEIDFVIGPIENYEDELNGYKTAHEAFLLIKDPEWSARLGKFSAILPQMQRNLPVENKYKAEEPGSDSDLNVYDVVLYRGDCNAAGKTIAINLPNDERVHIEKGTRKLLLKNAMQAKFDKILMPISQVVMNPEQQAAVNFGSFFENVTFHEVAHGLGVKNTINGKGTARAALKETYGTIEEAKADIMGLYLVDQLYQMGELEGEDVNNNYITFFAGIFRSVRFGATEAHGKANMLCFNYMKQAGAFTRNSEGIYTVDVEKMRDAATSLMGEILKYQAEGDLQAVRRWINEMAVVGPELQQDLDRIAAAQIAKDIFFVQGKDVLGLK